MTSPFDEAFAVVRPALVELFARPVTYLPVGARRGFLLRASLTAEQPVEEGRLRRLTREARIGRDQLEALQGRDRPERFAGLLVDGCRWSIDEVTRLTPAFATVLLGRLDPASLPDRVSLERCLPVKDTHGAQESHWVAYAADLPALVAELEDDLAHEDDLHYDRQRLSVQIASRDDVLARDRVVTTGGDVLLIESLTFGELPSQPLTLDVIRSPFSRG